MGIFSSKTKNDLEKLIEENDELKNTLHTFVQKHQSITEIENKITESQKQFAELNKRTEKLKNHLTKVDEELSTKKSLSEELIKNIDGLEKRKNDLENTIALIESNAPISDEVLTKISNNKIELEKLSEQYLTLQKNISFLRQEEARINNLIIQHDGNFDEVQYNFKKIEEEHNHIITELKEEESKKLSIIRSLDDKISLNEEIKGNLETAIISLTNQLAEKENLFTDFIIKRDSILEEIQKNKSAYDEFEYKFRFHKEKIDSLEEESKRLAERKNVLADEVRKFENIKNELNNKILKLKTEDEVISESITAKQKIIEELEKRRFEFEEAHLRLENNLAQVLQKFDEEQAASKTRLSLLKQEIIEKEKELSSKEKVLLEKTYHIAEYGGLSKVLQKERTTAEQIIASLKEEQSQLNEQIPLMREKINKQKSTLHELRSEIDQLENKKELLQREFKSIITQANNNYVSLDETNQNLQQGVQENKKILEELKEQVENYTEELRNLKIEVAKADTQKEEQASKVSELIALENNLRFQISEHEKKLNNNGND